tara:strand:+ start:53 stop:787 length:735 start_codon:yes stop_codon:yes gene_type:complete
MKNDTLIVIPIRMASSRLPGKPLVNIKGKAMIAHVWERATLSKCGDVIVACCDEEARDYLSKKKIPYVMTKKNLNSGTDRVYNAIEKSFKSNSYKYVINLQGDIPNISPQSIKKLALIIKQKSVRMATLVSKIKEARAIKDINIVKAAITKHFNFNKALYFSRSPIPYRAKEYFEHIGIYAYKMNTLKKFVNLKMGKLEKIESLEQLRALENGIEIVVGKVNKAPYSIDTYKDLEFFLKNELIK